MLGENPWNKGIQTRDWLKTRRSQNGCQNRESFTFVDESDMSEYAFGI